MSNNINSLLYFNIGGKEPTFSLFRWLRTILFIALLVMITLFQYSCKKAIEIDPPVNSITTEGAFSTDATATSAVIGIYSNLINTGTGVNLGSGAVTLYAGLSSDELLRLSLDGEQLQFRENNLLRDNSIVYSAFWLPAYFNIYQANTSLEGLQASQTLTPAVKTQLIGECKFLRAFLYFYLTNLWGDVPLLLTGSWEKTALLPRTKSNDIYAQIVSDLKDAQVALKDDYSVSKNERIRANKYAATALLSRVYLYQKKWSEAEAEATSIINNSSTYTLVTNLNSVFLKNSKEAIFQLQPSNQSYPWAIAEQYKIVEEIRYYLTDDLLNAFELNDARKTAWVNNFDESGTTFYFPYKYKISSASAPGGNVPEYYMVLRLAEQFLIRAEARAQQNKITEALEDLNAIRSRAGLPDTSANDQPSLLLAIENERQLELFAEWGHRWFDLVRTNRATSVLSPIKGGTWQATDALYPIPFSEIQNNPNLTQNLGY